MERVRLIDIARKVGGAIVDGIVGAVVWLSSNKILFAGLIVLTVWWLSYNYFAPRPFDDYRHGYVLLVLWYTIVFGIWEGAQKVVQAVQMKRDHHMQDLMLKGIAVSQQSLESISELVVAIREELDRAAERDEVESEQTKTLATLVERLLAAVQAPRGGDVHVA
ncbi:MAG: hypothetical protein ACYCUI_07110 [Vulcanimicrobiaceae bacterium]